MVKKLPKFLRPTKKKVIIAGIIAVIVIGAAVGVGIYKKNKAAETAASIKLSTVTKGDIEVLISGSGTVEPYERYEVLAMVEGDILSAPFEVGDTVQEGDILYQIDSSDAEIDLQKQENSLESSRLSNEETKEKIDNLSVTAPCSGVISGISTSVGEDVKSGVVFATVTDNQNLEVELPFNENQISAISVGQTATISSSSHMSTVTGEVIHINSTPTAQSDGSMLYMVTISFTNPGGFTNSTVVGGSVNGMVSPGSGTVEYSDEQSVTTETEGEITAINYKNGDYVKKGAVIAKIKNDSLVNDIKKSEISYQDAVLSLEDKKNALDDYSITSPITGTVISKDYKAGDTIDKSNSSVTLMVVADISRLKFSLSIDELDIAKVSAGQEVQITCDAVPDETFVGTITNVSMEGTTSNGVTSYTADVLIENPGTLRPSMNVDASVVVESASDVLMLPVSDVKTIGNTSYVYLKETDGSKKSESKNDSADAPQGMPEGSAMPQMPDGAQSGDGGMPPQGQGSGNSGGDGTSTGEATSSAAPSGGGDSAGGSESQRSSSRMPEAPDGFVTQVVTTGISNDDYIEIESGLSEGDQVYQQEESSSSSSTTTDMMGGGMGGGGGGPSGGGGGPSGGGGGMGGGGGGMR